MWIFFLQLGQKRRHYCLIPVLGQQFGKAGLALGLGEEDGGGFLPSTGFLWRHFNGQLTKQGKQLAHRQGIGRSKLTQQTDGAVGQGVGECRSQRQRKGLHMAQGLQELAKIGVLHQQRQIGLRNNRL